jgi:hypothetical protein
MEKRNGVKIFEFILLADYYCLSGNSSDVLKWKIILNW